VVWRYFQRPFPFKLEFHISYDVWGEGTEILREYEKKPNEDPRRSSTDLSFLPRLQSSSGDGGTPDC
ncbi:uncharacterized protein LY79DRAFT_703088, partial [Colletotrichum navitas]